MAEHCALCNLVYSRHWQMKPDDIRVKEQDLKLGHFHGFSSVASPAGKLAYCPPLMGAPDASTTPTDGLQVYAEVDLRQEAIDSATAAHRELLMTLPREPTNVDLKAGRIVSRAQAETILRMCYPPMVVGALSDQQAIDAAREIAKAVDYARGQS